MRGDSCCWSNACKVIQLIFITLEFIKLNESRICASKIKSDWVIAEYSSFAPKKQVTWNPKIENSRSTVKVKRATLGNGSAVLKGISKDTQRCIRAIHSSTGIQSWTQSEITIINKCELIAYSIHSASIHRILAIGESTRVNSNRCNCRRDGRRSWYACEGAQ